MIVVETRPRQQSAPADLSRYFVGPLSASSLWGPSATPQITGPADVSYRPESGVHLGLDLEFCSHAPVPSSPDGFRSYKSVFKSLNRSDSLPKIIVSEIRRHEII